MSKIAIIGGTGMTELETLTVNHREVAHTPFGPPSGTLLHGTLAGQEVVFLSRHGYEHSIPPHKINYRANIWALNKIGVDRIIAVSAVGSINKVPPGQIAIPDQIIDYTYAREHSFYLSGDSIMPYLDFSEPYCPHLRQLMLRAAKELCLEHGDSGVYGTTQGPRLETAAEIRRMKQDGCDFVGMTGMPEAALACELGIPYANCLVVVNWAAGVQPNKFRMSDMGIHVTQGMASVKLLFQRVMEMIKEEKKKNGL